VLTLIRSDTFNYTQDCKETQKYTQQLLSPDGLDRKIIPRRIDNLSLFGYSALKAVNSMGKTTPSIGVLVQQEKAALQRFRRALRKEDQRVFDELWTYVSKHLMACTCADHLLPLEVFLFAMLMEEHKEIMRLRRGIRELQDRLS
jgi:hypothetical protein